MTIPTKPSRNAENVFIFRVLFQRSFIDDADAVGGMEKLTGESGSNKAEARQIIKRLTDEQPKD